MPFSPQDFLSNLNSKNGPAKQNRFQVLIPIPQYLAAFARSSLAGQFLGINVSYFDSLSLGDASLSRYLALQCESAELPGKNIVTQDVKIYGPTFKVPYQTQFTDLVLTFLCTNDFYERKLFDTWLEAIMPMNTNNLRYPKDEATRYLTNLRIIQYDENIKEIYVSECIDSFPIGIAAQPVNWGAENFHRLSIQFAYQKYRTLYAGQTERIQLDSTFFGSRFFNYTNELLI